MHSERIRYERLHERDSHAAEQLLTLDADGGEGMLRVFAKAPELFLAAFIAEQLVALAQVNEPVPQSYLTVYVAPAFRGQGIGTAVAQHAETLLRAGGTEKVRSSFRAGRQSSQAFGRKLGYAPYFSSALLRRTGDPFPLEELPVRRYTDEDYLSVQGLYAAAFHDMRVRVGSFPDSVIAPPSEQERRLLAAEAEDHFVYEADGEIVAYSHLSGYEIGSVSVRSDLQRRGIGTKFVKYLCNEIYRRRGGVSVDLWCVVGNDARRLYDSLGFQETYRTDFMRKTL